MVDGSAGGGQRGVQVCSERVFWCDSGRLAGLHETFAASSGERGCSQEEPGATAATVAKAMYARRWTRRRRDLKWP